MPLIQATRHSLGIVHTKSIVDEITFWKQISVRFFTKCTRGLARPTLIILIGQLLEIHYESVIVK